MPRNIITIIPYFAQSKSKGEFVVDALLSINGSKDYITTNNFCEFNTNVAPFCSDVNNKNWIYIHTFTVKGYGVLDGQYSLLCEKSSVTVGSLTTDATTLTFKKNGIDIDRANYNVDCQKFNINECDEYVLQELGFNTEDGDESEYYCDVPDHENIKLLHDGNDGFKCPECDAECDSE